MNTITNKVIENCNTFSDSPFLIFENQSTITYRDFSTQLDKAISYFKKNYPRAPVNFSIIAPNCPNYLYVLFTLLENGGRAVNLNPHLTAAEIKERLMLGKVSILVSTTSLYEKLQPIVEETFVHQVYIIDEAVSGFKVLDHIELIPKSSPVTKHSNDIAFMQFTGGTSGVTKAAQITHQNVLSNLNQLQGHLNSYISLENLKVLISFPFYHIFSLVFNVLFFQSQGGACLLYKDLRNIDLIIDSMKRFKPNFTVGVNTWYNKLMNNARFLEIDFEVLRASLAGGEYVPVNTKKRWHSLTNKKLFSAYGLTETSSLAIVSPLDHTDVENSIGIPLPETQVALLNEKNEIVKGMHSPGEIALKGPQVACDYFENPEETESAFFAGWFKTGDIAERVGDHTFKLVDRKKDMISVSGNKVYPNEVESVIAKIKGIIDVGVVGKHSENSGETVAACIVVHPSSPIEDEEVIKVCKQSLSRYKIPKHIFRYTELPKTPIGKTARRILREEVNR